jgi:hypothetical protein
MDVADPDRLPPMVEVYRNLSRRTAEGFPVYSVRDRASGIVVAHVAAITLVEVTFSVSKAGRQRVLRERRKNVHAVIVGRPSAHVVEGFPDPVRYNPYDAATFVNPETGEPVTAAAVVAVAADGVSYQASR